MPSSRGIDIDDGRDQRDADADELNAELARTEDRYRRALADLDNYRKRAAREVERRTAEVSESMILDWLEVVDSVERAMQMEPEGPCQAGLLAVMQQMDSVLQRHGVTRTGAPGETFDPERHDAVATQAAGATPPHTVVDVARSGFALGDRVIRPAQVVVARAPEPSD